MINRSDTFAGTVRWVSMNTASGMAIMIEMIQIMMIMFLVRFAVVLNFSGRQIAYHLSTDMALRVRTETDTETTCNSRWNVSGDQFSIANYFIYNLSHKYIYKLE